MTLSKSFFLDNLTNKNYLWFKRILSMKKMSVGEFKTHFSDVIEEVKAGGKIAVTFGKKKEVVGYFLPEIPNGQAKRKLGILEGKASVTFHSDFKISEEEFLSL